MKVIDKRRYRNLKNIGFRFEPQPDMTVWELACFIAVIKSESVQHFEFYTNLPEPLKRHFCLTHV
jgi:hypothetical protein